MVDDFNKPDTASSKYYAKILSITGTGV